MTGFAYPYLWGLLLLAPVVYYLLPPAKGLHGDALRVTFLNDLETVNLRSGRIWQTAGRGGINAGRILLFVVYILFVAAAARPRWVGEPVRVRNEGRDILMVMDISTSMLEKDFSLNGRRISRLQAVKAVASDFIGRRLEDRIGLVLFGTRAYLQAPLTFDKKAVENILWNMTAGMAGNSTSIGDALGLALKSVKDSQNKNNKVIILLTDGENNDGSLSLPQAIGLAKHENVKIYTIGVGGAGSLMQSILSYASVLPQGLDEEGLKAIAAETEGRYFRASDTSALAGVYAEIDRLEPQSGEENYVREVREYYYIPLAAAVVLGTLLMLIRRRQNK